MTEAEFRKWLSTEDGLRHVGEWRNEEGYLFIIYMVPRTLISDEPDYMVSGDLFNWEQGWHFNGSKWLTRKQTLEGEELRAVQSLVNKDISDNAVPLTGFQNPMLNLQTIIPEPTHNGPWRKFETPDGEYTHYGDLTNGQHTRYYFAGKTLNYVEDLNIEDLEDIPLEDLER